MRFPALTPMIVKVEVSNSSGECRAGTHKR
jgi:hypothetical protein